MMANKKSDAIEGANWETERRIVLAVCICGIVGRILLACVSVGSNDATNWQGFSLYLQHNRMCELYADTDLFNNPPLVGLWGRAAFKIGYFYGVPFFPIFKIPGLLGEAVICWILFQLVPTGESERLRRWSPALYACSFVSFLISGFHGNTDPICFALIFGAAFLLEKRDRPLLAGLLFSVALNVKLIGLCLLPCYLARAWQRRQLARFGVGFLGGLSLFIPVLMQCGDLFKHNVFDYNPYPDRWGLLLFASLLMQKYPEYRSLIVQAAQSYITISRYLILVATAAISLLAAIRWRRDTFSICAISMAIFLILCPGFGVQYLAYLPPFLFVANPLLGAFFSLASGIFVLLDYYNFLHTTYPLQTIHTGPIPLELWPATLATWLSCLFIACQLINYSLRDYDVGPRLDTPGKV